METRSPLTSTGAIAASDVAVNDNEDDEDGEDDEEDEEGEE